MRSGLFLKFFAVMGALALIPAFFIAHYISKEGLIGLETSALELNLRLAERSSVAVNRHILDSDRRFQYVLRILRTGLEWRDKERLIQEFINSHPDLIEFSILSPAGAEQSKIYTGDSPNLAMVDRAQEEGFKRFQAAKTPTRLISPEAETLELYNPMGNGISIRLLVSIKELAKSLRQDDAGGSGFAILVDSAGRPLIYPREEVLSEERRRTVPTWDIVRTGLKAPAIGSKTDRQGGKLVIGAYARVPAIDGAVVTQELVPGVLEATKKFAWRMVAGAVLLSLVGATLLARRLTSPLLALSRAAEAVSRGDFSTKVEVATRDELQDLADIFNRMTDKLREYSDLQVDRVLAEQKKTEAILFSINDGIVMTDKEGRIRLANRRALEFFGVDAGAVLEGKTWDEAIPDAKLRAAVQEVAGNPKPEVFREMNLSTEKSHRFVRIAARTLFSPSKEELGVVTALRDVTLEKELEKMKEEFLHYITHDLRNPLGSAMGFIEVLLKGLAGVLNPEQHNMVSSIQRSMSRLMGLINNILDIAKMESGRIRLQLQPVSVAGVACRSMTILESLSQQKKIPVTVEAAEEYSIDADGDLLERVFTNLLGNAIKYTPPGGKITISIVDEAAGLKCCVADTGEGIPESYLGRVFDKFEQVTGQRKGGTGLGLTIARYFVEAHRGKIWVESELGKGSQFYFTIPKTLALDPKGAVVVTEKVA